MNAPIPKPQNPDFAAPALVVGARLATWLSADGEVEELALAAAMSRVRDEVPIVCHALATATRLGAKSMAAYDILELFAFTRPAQFCLPTPGGLAAALNLPPPGDAADAAFALQGAARALLAELAAGRTGDPRRQERLGALAMTMARGGWRWGPAVLAVLGLPSDQSSGGLNAWHRLPEREDAPPPPPPSDHAIGPDDARAQLAALIGDGAESRPQQFDYAAAAAGAFQPRQEVGMPRLVLAEAGTGVGKTLGYIAPASLWARKNGGTVWLSTYTRNLQRQIDGELDRLYPDPKQKRRNVVVRKGRENYLCLLNFEDATKALATSPGGTVALGLIARWVENSRDGDMVGGDFPAWLATLFGGATIAGLTDRRGECIYSACRHYSKCFIERSRRESERAEIVVANHALVMIRAVLEAGSGQLPLRYVFDEGHHVFDAADSAFAANVAGSEGAELRRWLLGNEGGRGRGGRARGLEARIGDLIGDDGGLAIQQNILRAATALAAPGWLQRLTEGAPRGPMETFLAHVHRMVLARVDNDRSPYGLEVSVEEPEAGLLQAAGETAAAFEALRRPLLDLARHLVARLDDDADELDTPTRLRIEAAARSLKRRADMVQAWRAMLLDLGQERPEQFVDWFAIERWAGRDRDVGMHRHWVDPSQPFAEAVLRQAHGVLITSATLRDNPPDAPDDWTAAEVRTGALHLAQPAVRASLASPFDYPGATRVLVVRDVNRNQADQVAAAYRELFLAAGGGGLGLFTAIQRLRAVHQRIAKPLDEAGIPLLAQHIDAMDTGTLVDIFRAEENTCLLGTDAVRDGVDVPGRSLRLIVFDRVPWPRPDILHRARKKSFGSGYDDMIARLRLKQAYGRLLRRADDRGVFVMLDAMLPTRLTTAFPPGVEVQRIGLAEAIQETRKFLED